MKSTGYTALFILRQSAVIGAFRSSLFRQEVAPSVVLCCTTLLLCFLIVGIRTSGISIPLFLSWHQCQVASGLVYRNLSCRSPPRLLRLYTHTHPLYVTNVTTDMMIRCQQSDFTLCMSMMMDSFIGGTLHVCMWAHYITVLLTNT